MSKKRPSTRLPKLAPSAGSWPHFLWHLAGAAIGRRRIESTEESVS